MHTALKTNKKNILHLYRSVPKTNSVYCTLIFSVWIKLTISALKKCMAAIVIFRPRYKTYVDNYGTLDHMSSKVHRVDVMALLSTASHYSTNNCQWKRVSLFQPSTMLAVKKEWVAPSANPSCRWCLHMLSMLFLFPCVCVCTHCTTKTTTTVYYTM